MSSLTIFSLRNLVRVAVISTILLLLTWHSYGIDSVSSVSAPGWSFSAEHKCVSIPGLDDILVVLRTGATESSIKLPVHFRTTLKCVPHYVVYSDFEEDVDGHHVMDSLDTVSENYQANNSDFELYNRLKKDGRAAIESQEIEKWSSVENSSGGMLQNPAWKLDKWKFLPLIEKALQQRPEAKWYVFMEADTFLLWSNLVEWLSKYDETKPYYLGNQQQIGDILFGHGGSGFAISNPAMQLAAENFRINRAEYEEFTANHWAGDCVLGKLLADSGTPLRWSWPNLQSGPISSFRYTADAYNKRLYCHKAVSYHHMIPEEIEAFWHFEQQQLKDGSASLRHKDVFENFVLPHLKSSRDNWDNFSEEHVDIEGDDFFEACKDVCLRKDACLQFSVTREGGCHISSEVKLGRPTRNVPEWRSRSGWMLDRIETSVRDMEACGDQEWIL